MWQCWRVRDGDAKITSPNKLLSRDLKSQPPLSPLRPTAVVCDLHLCSAWESVMERSRKILEKIASSSHRVVTAANLYADRRDLDGVPRCHFQLEEVMRRISVACGCLAGTLSSEVSENSVDVRLQDWLASDEPRMCLDTLGCMETLLQPKDDSSWTSWFSRMGRRGSTTAQDKIHEAMCVFDARKGCFHFLDSAEIWRVLSVPLAE